MANHHHHHLHNSDEITDEELDRALGVYHGEDGDEGDGVAEEINNNEHMDISLHGPQNEQSDSESTSSSSASAPNDDSDEDLWYYLNIAKRLEQKDPSLRTLQIGHQEFPLPMVDLAVEFSMGLLAMAREAPSIERLELRGLPLDYEPLASAVLGLLIHDITNPPVRTWSHVSLECCGALLSQFVDHLVLVPKLNSLSLYENSMSPPCIEGLGGLLEEQNGREKPLRELRLKHDFRDPSSMLRFAKGLGVNDTLTTLDFTNCTFSRHAEAEQNSPMDNEDTREVVSSLDGSNVRSHHSDVIKELATGLRRNKSLFFLFFKYCSLDDLQTSIIVQSIYFHPSLTWLDLTSSRIESKAKEAILVLLSEGTAVTGLSLIDCSLTDDWMPDLVEALARNSRIRNLHLCENNFTDDGIRCFAENMNRFPTLKTIWVHGNPFGERGASFLQNAVSTNYKLEVLAFDRDQCPSALDRIDYYMFLNRYGRRLLASPEEQRPLALWPHVLERCQRRDDSTRRHRDDSSNSPPGFVDVIYSLLHGPAFVENSNLYNAKSASS